MGVTWVLAAAALVLAMSKGGTASKVGMIPLLVTVSNRRAAQPHALPLAECCTEPYATYAELAAFSSTVAAAVAEWRSSRRDLTLPRLPGGRRLCVTNQTATSLSLDMFQRRAAASHTYTATVCRVAALALTTGRPY